MLAKWVKNNTGNPLTRVGQQIQAGAYFEIPVLKLQDWQNDSNVLTDIGSGDLIMSKDQAEVYHITDVADAINFLKNTDGPKDLDGAPLTRPKVTKTGWHYQLHAMDIITAQTAGFYNKDKDGNDLGFVTYTMKDDQGDTTADPVECVETHVTFEATYDIEIIGAMLKQGTAPTVDVRMWLVAVPDVPELYGGSKPFGEGGINFKHLGNGGGVDSDGRAPKFLAYDAVNHTSKFLFILKHPANTQHEFSVLWELFKE